MARRENPTARQLYEAFHEVDPRQIVEMEIELPGEWMVLGEAEDVCYRPPRHSRRAGHVYQHEFGDVGLPVRLPGRPLLAYSPELPGVLLLIGDYVVDERGIVG